MGQNVDRRLRATCLQYGFDSSPEFIRRTVMLTRTLYCFEISAFGCDSFPALCARLAMRFDKRNLITLQFSIKPENNSWPHLFAGIHTFTSDRAGNVSSSHAAQLAAQLFSCASQARHHGTS